MMKAPHLVSVIARVARQVVVARARPQRRAHAAAAAAAAAAARRARASRADRVAAERV